MFNKNKTRSLMTNLSFSLKSMVGECKLRLIITFALIVIGLFIGVFVAIRLNNQSILDHACDYGYVDFSLTKISSLSSFFWRLLSLCIFLGLLVLFSLNKFLYPIAWLMLIYRAYLIGLNLVIIILSSGLAGLFTSILIILPCQIVSIAILATFFCVFSKQRVCVPKDAWKTLAIAAILLLVVDIVESILLAVFGANIILVI